MTSQMRRRAAIGIADVGTRPGVLKTARSGAIAGGRLGPGHSPSWRCSLQPVLLDAAGHGRAPHPAGYHAGRPPRNTRRRYPHPRALFGGRDHAVDARHWHDCHRTGTEAVRGRLSGRQAQPGGSVLCRAAPRPDESRSPSTCKSRSEAPSSPWLSPLALAHAAGADWRRRRAGRRQPLSV